MRANLLVKPWPWNTLTEPTPADWGAAMTVCVALYSTQLGAFVCATDSMISTGDMSADHLALKFAAVGQSYVTMFAGNDISAISPILGGVQRRLISMSHSNKVEDVISCFKLAFADERLKKAEALIMPPGMTIADFYANGLNQFGAELFSRLFHEVENIKLDIQFLVCGFDAGHPKLFTIADPGVETNYDLLGFWAIGSGTNNALGSLFNLRRPGGIIHSSAEEILYRALEAKFFAESAAGVGRETKSFVLYKDATRSFLHDSLDEIRTIWEQSSFRPVPDGGRDAARKIRAAAKNKAKSDARKRERKRKKVTKSGQQ